MTECKILRREFGCRKSLFIAPLCLVGGFYLAGMLFVLLVMYLTHSEDYAEMGSFLALIVTLVYFLIRYSVFTHMDFNLGLSMGRTRRACIASALLQVLLPVLSAALLLMLLNRIEGAVYARLYPTLLCEISLAKICSPGFMLPAALGFCVLVFFISACLMRYGSRVWWLFWVVWMFCCLGLPRMFDRDYEGSILFRMGSTLSQLAGGLSPLVRWGAVLLIAAAALLAALRMYMRAEVRF